MKPRSQLELPGILLLMFIVICPALSAQQIERVKWTHFSIDTILPDGSWGTGDALLADFDQDGDLDVALSRRNTLQAYWYQRVNDSIWIPHVMGGSEKLEDALGSIDMDVDGDGDTDIVSKIWNADGLKYHADLWRNEYIYK